MENNHWRTYEVKDGVGEKIKKNLNKEIRNRSYIKIAKRSSIAAAILLVLLIGGGIASPVLAKNIPINSISQMLNDKHGYHGEYTSYSQVVDKSVTDSGITITINEALADDSKLILGYTIKSNSRIKGLEVVGLTRLVEVNGSTAGGRNATGQYLDDTTFMGSDEVSYHSSSTSDILKVDLKIDDIMGIKGKWNFAFTVSKDELVKNSTVFKTNNIVDLPDCIVTVDKVVFSPIDTTINFSWNYYKDKGINAGNRPFYTWIIFDDKGIELIPKGNYYGLEAQFEKVNNIPKYLTVIPCRTTPTTPGRVVSRDDQGRFYVIQPNPDESEKIIDGNYPIELSQGKMGKLGKLIIKDIKTENGKTVVRYTAEGKAPYSQGKSLSIKDAAGEYVTPSSYDIRRDKEHPNDFTMVFPALDLNKRYSVCETPQFDEFMENLKFKIELTETPTQHLGWWQRTILWFSSLLSKIKSIF